MLLAQDAVEAGPEVVEGKEALVHFETAEADEVLLLLGENVDPEAFEGIPRFGGERRRNRRPVDELPGVVAALRRDGDTASDARDGPGPKIDVPERPEFLVGGRDGRAMDSERLGERPRGRQRVARDDDALADPSPDVVHDLPENRLVRCFVKREQQHSDSPSRTSVQGKGYAGTGRLTTANSGPFGTDQFAISLLS